MEINEINKQKLIASSRRPNILCKSASKENKISCLVDSGAAASCLAQREFHKIAREDIRVKLQIPNGMKLKGAGGAQLEVTGYYTIRLIVAGRKIEHDFFIVKNLTSDGIMGNDFIALHQLVIWGTGNETKVRFLDQLLNGKPTPTKAVNEIGQFNEEDWTIPILSTETVTIPARSAIKIGIKYNQNDHSTLLFTQNDNRGVEMIEGIVDTKAEKPTILAVNNSMLNIMIERNEHIGNGEPQKETNIWPIDEIKRDDQQPEYKPHMDTSEPKDQNERWKRIKMQIKTGHLPPEHKPRYEELFKKFSDIFSLHKYEIGLSNVGEHVIRLNTDVPLYTKQFKIPEAHEIELEEHIENLKKAGCLEISTSPYNSPIFLVKKKDGSSRIVLDYRLLNFHSMPDKYSIRDVRACLDEIGKAKAKIFSCLDVTSSYHQVALQQESRQYTSFHITGKPKLQWTRSPMGLTGSGSTFSKLMDIIMQGLDGVINYIDDILCHSTDHDTQLARLEQVFMRVRSHGIKLNPRKCEFGKEQIDYLGFYVDGDGVKPGQSKTDAIVNFPTPNSAKKIRQFLGIANYFRGFIRNFTTTAAPLTALTSTNNEWQGGELPPAARDAFDTLKEKLNSRPCMAYPDFTKEFLLYCDAATGDDNNKGGLGAFLVQIHEERPRPICFLSRTLKPHEMNLSAYALEMKSAVWAINTLHHYLKGRKFTIISDNKPLVTNSNNTSKAINRLQQTLMDYDAEIIHMPGKANAVADILSRNAAEQKLTNNYNNMTPQNIDEAIMVSAIEGHEWDFKIAQQMDPKLELLRKASKDKTILNGAKMDAKLKNKIKTEIKYAFIDEYGILRRHLPSTDTTPAYAPMQMREEIIKAAHQSIMAGHGGVARTTNKIAHHYFWFGMTKDVKDFVKQCQRCQLAKTLPPGPAPITSLPVPDGPNERVHIDLMGPLKSSGPFAYILVATDAFTKYAMAIPIPNKKASTIATALFQNWIATFSCPTMWISDQGREFVNNLFKEFNAKFGIKAVNTSPYHPQSNSSAESYNRSIIKYMRAMLKDDETNEWHKKLKEMSLAYNTHLHQTIKTTPFALTFTFPAKLPYFDLSRPAAMEKKEGGEFERLKTAFNLATQHSKDAITEQEKYFNTKKKPRSFQVGDRVMLLSNKNAPKKMGENKKFLDNFEGPYQIVQKFSELNYAIAKFPHGKPIMTHINRIKPFLFSDLFKTPTTMDTAGKDGRPEKNDTSDTGKALKTHENQRNDPPGNKNHVKFQEPRKTNSEQNKAPPTARRLPMRIWTPPPAETAPDTPPNTTSGDTPSSSNNAVEENQGEVENQTGNEIDAPSQQELMERMRLEARTTAQRIREMARLEGRRAASECKEAAPARRRSLTPDPLAGIPRLSTFQSTGEQAKSVQRLSTGGRQNERPNPITRFMNQASESLRIPTPTQARMSARIRKIPAPHVPLVPRRPPEYKEYPKK